MSHNASKKNLNVYYHKHVSMRTQYVNFILTQRRTRLILLTRQLYFSSKPSLIPLVYWKLLKIQLAEPIILNPILAWQQYHDMNDMTQSYVLIGSGILGSSRKNIVPGRVYHIKKNISHICTLPIVMISWKHTTDKHKRNTLSKAKII